MPHPKPLATKVIIVDDSPSLRATLHHILKEEGYEVVAELADGSKLDKSIADLNADIVCLDFNLPGRDGLELLREIGARHPKVAVIMITGVTDPAVHVAATEAGAAGFLSKPIAPAQILEELHQVVHAQQLLKAARARPAPAAGDNRPRVVIADDSVTMRQLLSAILQEAGCEVVAEAVDGRQAVDLVERHRPDLTCLDVEMPVMSGLDALKKIHALDPALKVLMVTHHGDKDTVRAAAAGGARGYVLKPYQPAKVITAVRTLLKP